MKELLAMKKTVTLYKYNRKENCMNNIFSYLKPKEGEKEKYDAIIMKYSLEENINSLWYHSAGMDFRSLYFSSRKNGLPEIAGGKPCLYIYTDMSKDIIDKIKDGDLFNSGSKKITVNKYTELEFEGNIKDYFPSSISKDSIDYNADYYSVFFFDLNLGDNEGSVPLLYFVWENTAFLKAFVIERNIRIKYFQKPREYGFGGGWFPSQVYLLFYLGIMGTEYLFLENNGNYRSSIDIAKEVVTKDKTLHDIFMSEDNYVPQVKYIGTTLKNIDRHEHYDIIRLFKDTRDISEKSFNDKIIDIFRLL